MSPSQKEAILKLGVVQIRDKPKNQFPLAPQRIKDLVSYRVESSISSSVSTGGDPVHLFPKFYAGR